VKKQITPAWSRKAKRNSRKSQLAIFVCSVEGKNDISALFDGWTVHCVTHGSVRFWSGALTKCVKVYLCAHPHILERD